MQLFAMKCVFEVHDEHIAETPQLGLYLHDFVDIYATLIFRERRGGQQVDALAKRVVAMVFDGIGTAASKGGRAA